MAEGGENEEVALQLMLPRGRKEALNTKLSVTVEDIMKMIEQKYNLHPIQLIFKGKVLAASKTLHEQSVCHRSKIMIRKMTDEETQKKVEKEEKQQQSQSENLKKTEKGCQILLEDDADDLQMTQLLEIVDHNGKMIKVQDQKKVLVSALLYHERGRAFMKRKDYHSSLDHLLKAENLFDKYFPTLLKTVDNYVVLQLDILWCHWALKSLESLNKAPNRLQKAEKYLHACYGEERAKRQNIKGNTEQKEVLLLRLYLLKSLLAFHHGLEMEATELLQKAENQHQRLLVDPTKMEELMSRNYSEQEARLGLRACGGDTDAAAAHIDQRREEKEKAIKRIRQHMEAIEVLQSLGFSRKEADKALSETEGDMDRAYRILLDRHQDQLSSSKQNTAETSVGGAQQSSTQQEPQLLSARSSLPDNLLDFSDSGNAGNDPVDDDLVKKLLDDISKEDYLDLTLEEEKIRIDEIKSYFHNNKSPS